MKIGISEQRLVGYDDNYRRWVAIGDPWDHDTLAFLADGTDAVARARQAMTAAQRAMPAPSGLPFSPTSLRDFSLWESHMINAARGMVHTFASAPTRALVAGYERITRTTFPALKPKSGYRKAAQFYFGNHQSIIADGDTAPWPPYSEALDFELELGVVIARPVRDCTPAQGRDAIGGFVVLNDCTARDTQWYDVRGNSFGGMVKAKSFTSAISAVLVTADDVLPRWTTLQGRVRVNGETWCQGSAAHPTHDLGNMIAYAAAGETLEAGALLGTGTLPGCCGIEVGRLLRPGDTVECEIDTIGSVTITHGTPGGTP